MKDVIEEQRKNLTAVLAKIFEDYILDRNQDKFGNIGIRSQVGIVVNEAFLKIANEADFIINRLQGEAGIIDRAAEKLPNVSEMLKRWAQVLRGYAARIENSQAPEFNK